MNNKLRGDRCPKDFWNYDLNPITGHRDGTKHYYSKKSKLNIQQSIFNHGKQ